MGKKDRRIKKEEKKAADISQLIEKNSRMVFHQGDVKSLVAPDGVNPNPLSYMTINDMGKDIYIRMFYVDALPKRTTFATTFAPLFGFEDVTASVFIEPMLEGKATSQLDKQVLSLETELNEATKAGNSNRKRKINSKLNKAESWASAIEDGENALYEVGFLFTLYAKSLEQLSIKTGDFITRAREKGISLVACFSVHPEAFLSNGPFNKVFRQGKNVIQASCIKRHPMDKLSLADIFSHTKPSFSHESGIPAGHNMKTMEAILWDPYSPSHNGFNAIFVGKTGTGKSATIKMYTSRLEPFDYRFGIVDSDKRGSRGEYCPLCERLGGIVFSLKPGEVKNILNPYELDEQVVYNEETGEEYRTLSVLDKINDVVNTFMTMIRQDKVEPDFNTVTYIESILADVVASLFDEKGIYEGEPDSLYEEGNIVEGGVLKIGKKKKALPTISETFMKILHMQRVDENEYHKEPYNLILDCLKAYVRELYYRTDTLERVSAEEYKRVSQKGDSVGIAKYKKIKGHKAYYDGQSTVVFSRNTPCVDIDISDLPKDDIPVGQIIALNFLDEHLIKKNSENPKKAGKLVIIIDEAHRMFGNEASRKLIADKYRTARKRNVSVWTCTQSIVDFSGYPETESIVDNSTSKFIFKQDSQHREFLAQKTVLTLSQVDAVLALGGDPNDPESKEHKGEVCLIDNDTVVFLKVDYLFATEKEIVETDVNKIKQFTA